MGATWAERLDEGNTPITWAQIRLEQPDLAPLTDDVLDACLSELQTRDDSTPLPTSEDGGFASGAVPIALLAAMIVWGLVGTGGDVFCQAAFTSQACSEQASRKAAKQ